MKINPQLAVVGFGIGLAAGAVYLLREFWSGAKDAADKIGDAVIDPLAKKIAGPVQGVADGFTLPGGRRVTFDQLIASGGKLSGNQTLVWQGVTYRLTNRMPDGWYAAERA